MSPSGLEADEHSLEGNIKSHLVSNLCLCRLLCSLANWWQFTSRHFICDETLYAAMALQEKLYRSQTMEKIFV